MASADSPCDDRPPTRRGFLAATAAGAAALAGCGGGGDDDQTTTTPASQLRTEEDGLDASWPREAYRSTDAGALIVAVEVTNTASERREGTLRIYFTKDGTDYEETAAVDLASEESEVYELVFENVPREEIDGVQVYRELA